MERGMSDPDLTVAEGIVKEYLDNHGLAVIGQGSHFHQHPEDGVMCLIDALATALRAERETAADFLIENLCPRLGCRCNTTMTEPCPCCHGDCQWCNAATLIRARGGEE